MPEIVTALTIPPKSSALHRLLEATAIQSVLVAASYETRDDFLRALSNLVERGLVRRAVLEEVGRVPEGELLTALADVQAGSGPATELDLRLEEFDALQRAAQSGHPPVPPTGRPPQFEVIRDGVRFVTTPNGRRLRVTPVSRLRVVMVQVGYRRLEPAGDLVNRPLLTPSRIWYPGLELSGEGIFVDLDPADGAADPDRGTAASEWFAAWLDPQGYRQHDLGTSNSQLHPTFVWWHTLSHRLLFALSVDSGYSSAAVRERVYARVDSDTGTSAGGVLVYTAQPGGDGTLGGLIALVPEFERVLAGALRRVDSCSNDPICDGDRMARGRYNGAACYACCLASETSCEHRNMRLDRHLLVENPV